MTPPGRLSLTAQVGWYFTSHPGEWLDARALAHIAGIGGWRTRVSELRHPPYSLDIRWRLRKWPDGRNRSQYCCYTPTPGKENV